MAHSAPISERTATIVGIDEAGYGPLLGPLIVSAVAFDVPLTAWEGVQDPAAGPDLWALLRSAVCRRPGKRGSRLAVADSKVLHKHDAGGGGVRLLERAALAFLMQQGEMPRSLRSLLTAVCPDVLASLPDYHWYADADVDLPSACTPDALGTQRNSLAEAMASAGVTFRGAWVEVLPEGQFNQLLGATHNKAVVLFGRTTRLMQRVADSVGSRPLGIWADRQGGRISYRKALMTAFEDARFEILEESPERSGYRLHRPTASWAVRFVMKGESHHLPVALASVFSKYIRELFMTCFNRYWCSHLPDLRPTAGYYQDGQRFLADIDALITSRKLDRQWLVRMA
jgi:ribonuclease HII